MNNVKKTFIQPDGLLFLLLSLSTISLLLLAPAGAAAAGYTKIDPPGSIDTHALSISGGNIAGWYEDPVGDHGFLRSADGTITSFDAPGSSATFASSVNASGVITGGLRGPQLLFARPRALGRRDDHEFRCAGIDRDFSQWHQRRGCDHWELRGQQRLFTASCGRPTGPITVSTCRQPHIPIPSASTPKG